MSKTTVEEFEKMERAHRSAIEWWNLQKSDQTTDFVMERLALHRDLPILVGALEYQMKEVRGIIREADKEDKFHG